MQPVQARDAGPEVPATTVIAPDLMTFAIALSSFSLGRRACPGL